MMSEPVLGCLKGRVETKNLRPSFEKDASLIFCGIVNFELSPLYVS